MARETLVPSRTVRAAAHRSLPAGAGFLIAGAASLMLWGAIAGIAAIV